MKSQTIVLAGALRTSGRTKQMLAELGSALVEKGYQPVFVDKEKAEKLQEELTDRCEVCSGDSRTAVRDLQQLTEVTGRLQDRIVTIELEDSDEMRSSPESQEVRRLVDAVEKLPRVTVRISDHRLGDNIADVLVSQAYVKGPDRPAWVSPYGPARTRRR